MPEIRRKVLLHIVLVVIFSHFLRKMIYQYLSKKHLYFNKILSVFEKDIYFVRFSK
jgi:hypothetical protein